VAQSILRLIARENGIVALYLNDFTLEAGIFRLKLCRVGAFLPNTELPGSSAAALPFKWNTSYSSRLACSRVSHQGSRVVVGQILIFVAAIGIATLVWWRQGVNGRREIWIPSPRELFQGRHNSVQ
jgi:hypothetical protein